MHDDISFLVPLQLVEHAEVVDQSDQLGHGEVLQSTILVRNVESLLPVQKCVGCSQAETGNNKFNFSKCYICR